MALKVDEITAVLGRGRPPEMTEADIIERRGRLKARDMPAKMRGVLVGAQDDRNGIPSDDRTDTALDLAITRRAPLVIHWNRVHIRSVRVVRQIDAARSCLLNKFFEQEVRALDALNIDDRFQRIQPFRG